ncbi:MAG: class I SAM-dependent methyltransferase [Spirosomataceae bacterium]
MSKRSLFFSVLTNAIEHGSIVFKDDLGETIIGSGEPSVSIKVHNQALYGQILGFGNLGLGESYMNSYFDVESGTLEDFLSILLQNRIDEKVKFSLPLIWNVLGIKIQGWLRGQWKNVQHHYDIGNDLFESFLDKSWTYSCGYANTPTDTDDQLQENKFERICQKLELKPGEHLLDIGCGFGGLLIYAAQHFGVTGIGITNSKEHCARANKRIQELGLKNLEVQLMDYQEITGSFDKIVSVGMLEHVPRAKYDIYFKKIKANLKPNGKGLVHAVGANSHTNEHDPFIQKYIFPSSNQVRLSEVSLQLEKNNLFIQDVENMIRHYGYTAQGWIDKFRENRSTLQRYSDEFLRMWEYYLCCCKAAANYSDSALYQVLFMSDHRSEIPLRRV